MLADLEGFLPQTYIILANPDLEQDLKFFSLSPLHITLAKNMEHLKGSHIPYWKCLNSCISRHQHSFATNKNCCGSWREEVPFLFLTKVGFKLLLIGY